MGAGEIQVRLGDKVTAGMRGHWFSFSQSEKVKLCLKVNCGTQEKMPWGAPDVHTAVNATNKMG
jgi:hypothetical protein